MSTAVWAGLAFFLFVLAAGTAWLAYQLLQAWRLLRQLPGGALAEVRELNRSAAELEQRVARVERQVTELQVDVERLGVSLARARVLVGAVGEVRSMVASARGFLPSK